MLPRTPRAATAASTISSSRPAAGRTLGQRGLNIYTCSNGKGGNTYRCDKVAHGYFQQPVANTMMSRHKRPQPPPNFQLTTRDVDVLKSVYQHRFLTAVHIHALHFHPSSLRVAQVRLQRLWAGNLLDRTYLMPEFPDIRDRYVGQPLYSLATRGAFHVADAIGIQVSGIPHSKAQNRRGYTWIRHNLVFTDLAVAFEVFTRRQSIWSATTTREDFMRAAAGARTTCRGAIVPDGAITLSGAGAAKPQTLLVEVVRAGVRAGNANIRRKMLRYREALRSGFFRDAYSFTWVRNIVFLTTSLVRARNLADLARHIPGAENLFRFGVYETRRNNRAAPRTLLTSERLGQMTLVTPAGKPVSFLPTISNSSPQSHV